MRDPQADGPEASAIDALESRIPEIARSMLERWRPEVPVRAGDGDPESAEAAYAHCLEHVRAILTAARERRPPHGDELRFVREHARMRAWRGVPLDALLHGYRMGHRAVIQAVMDTAHDTPGGAAAALALTDRALGHVETITTTFTEAYLAARQERDAGVEAARRALVDGVLAGVDPGPGGADRARALGLDPEGPYVVGCVAGEAAEREPHALAARVGLLDLRDGRPGVTVVREREVVAVLRLGDRTPTALREDLLRVLGPGCTAGVSLPCRGLGDLGRGYAEARAILRTAGPGEVASLLEATPSGYLAATADATALRLIDPRIRGALEADADATGVLTATFLAFLDADLSAPAAAEALHVHPNTVYYRLDKLARATGRDPRRIHDIVELLLAVRLLGPGIHPAPPAARSAGVPQRRPRRGVA